MCVCYIPNSRGILVKTVSQITDGFKPGSKDTGWNCYANCFGDCMKWRFWLIIRRAHCFGIGFPAVPLSVLRNKRQGPGDKSLLCECHMRERGLHGGVFVLPQDAPLRRTHGGGRVLNAFWVVMCNNTFPFIDIHCNEGFITAILLICTFAVIIGFKIWLNVRSGKWPSDIFS